MASLSPEAWRSISPYLDQALTLSPQQRAAWLASLRESSPELAAEVQALLDEFHQVEGEQFLEQSLRPLPAIAGQTIGAYTLIAPAGEGGMSTVWVAERSDGRFERRVVVKCLKIALAGDGGGERFKREGSILARLSHPHIAQLLDAGVLPDGQPYLVLEQVDGDHIDRHADGHELDIESRVRLFLDVLSAVAHAHANLIVHRDLKPSNVLVSRDGQVKLVDFGIAKLIEDEGARPASPEITRESGGAMTLLYAAPEQVTGGTITTATDTYALGVLLYLLLTGRHPSGPGPHSPADLIRQIVERDPPCLSDAVADKNLHRQLRGDLETIIAKAMKKDSRERYGTVTAMADDLRRYLLHQPISARSDTLAYRAAKFVRRNRTATALAALVLVVTLAGAVSTMIEVQKANRERAMAQRRFSQVRQLANKVLKLDEVIRVLPGSTQARHEIVAVTKEYLEALAPEARGDPDLAMEIGLAYAALAKAQGVPGQQNLGQYALADESLRKAESFLEPVRADSSRNQERLRTLVEISNGRMILARQGGRPREEILAQARTAASRMDLLLSADSPSTLDRKNAAKLFYDIALTHRNLHLHEDAVRYAKRSTEVVRNLPSAEEESSDSQSLLADLMRISGDFDGALAQIRAARAAFERTSSKNDHRRLNSWFLILWREGVILGGGGGLSLNRPDEATVPLQQAFDLLEDWARRDANDASVRILFDQAARELGAVLREREPQRALAVYDQAILRLGEVKSNARVLRGQAGLLAGSSYALRRLRRPAEARERIDHALRLLRETKDYPTDRIETDSELEPALRALGDHYAETGQPVRAAEVYQELLDKILASKPDPANDLRHAIKLSRIYESLAELQRRNRHADRAAEISTVRLELWRGWERKLPHSSFILRQLSAP